MVIFDVINKLKKQVMQLFTIMEVLFNIQETNI